MKFIKFAIIRIINNNNNHYHDIKVVNFIVYDNDFYKP